MDGVEVDVAELRAAGERAAAAADRASGADLGARVGGLDAAMPGSTAGRRGQALAAAWREELSTWVDVVRGHARGLTASADGYARDEAEAARTFGGGG
jgi:hypothetical protein